MHHVWDDTWEKNLRSQSKTFNYAHRSKSEGKPRNDNSHGPGVTLREMAIELEKKISIIETGTAVRTPGLL